MTITTEDSIFEFYVFHKLILITKWLYMGFENMIKI